MYGHYIVKDRLIEGSGSSLQAAACITTVILELSVAAQKKAEAPLRHKPFAVLPTAKFQLSHYIIIENLIINHNHMKKKRCCQNVKKILELKNSLKEIKPKKKTQKAKKR